jgi:hypothetical protein
LLHVSRSSGLTPGAADITPEKIERDGTDRRVKQPSIFDRMLFSPKLDESFLDNVFGVRELADELAGEEHESRPEFRETAFPIFFMSDDILHDLFTVF